MFLPNASMVAVYGFGLVIQLILVPLEVVVILVDLEQEEKRMILNDLPVYHNYVHSTS